MEYLIYDYETLGQNTQTLPIVSVAFLKFNTDRFESNPYSYSELLNMAEYYKFNVAEQVGELGRTIDKNTLEWWTNQPKDVRDSQLKPSDDDISIYKLPELFYNICQDKKMLVLTRGNTFDPMITENLFLQLGKEQPYPWWNIRDVRSLFEGMAWGSGLKHSFEIPELEEHFKKHNPIHDVAMDVYRFQTLVRAIS